MDTALQLRALRKQINGFAFCFLGIVVANFALDLWRRHDFEKARAEVRALADEATARTHSAYYLLQESGAVVKDLEDRVAALDQKETELFLASQDVAPPPGAEKQTPNGPSAETPPPLAARSPGEILAAPLEEVLAGLEEARNDPFLSERYPKLLDARTWVPGQVVADFEDALGVSLSPEEREFAERTVGVYREATETAYASYRVDLDASMIERTLDGDFDPLLPTGEFDASKVPPGDVLAVSLVGTKQFVWEKNEYPELYRKNVVYQYLPLAMLSRLREFVNERRAR
jgi:hypothetical protein